MIEISLNSIDVLPKYIVLRKLLTYFSKIKLSQKRILFICEDLTRATPIHWFFPEVIRVLFKQTKNITILFALGTHRPMTLAEMKSKLGVSCLILKRLKLINHCATDDSQLTEIGIIDRHRVKLNKEILRNDIVVLINSVIPHRVMGFSGGAKILCPGIANKEMIDYSHWKSNEYPEEQIIGQIENPMRHMLDKIGRLAEKKFKAKFISINCVTVPAGIVDIFIGDFYSSYRQAAQLSYKIFVKNIPECTKMLVILDEKSVDFWQAAKAVYNCARVIKPGGTIVIRGALQEGLSLVHGKIIEQYGYSTPDKIQKLVADGKLKDIVISSHMIRVSQHLQRIKIVVSSEGISERVCRSVGFDYMDSEETKRMEFDYIVRHPVDIVLDKSRNEQKQ